jgi:hypothetical protein
MNIRIPARREEGFAIAFAITTLTILGILITAYLSLVSARNNSCMRSQAWNACIAVAEAGVEEALSHARENIETNMTANGWVKTGTNYFLTRRLDSNYFRVFISTNFPYIIRSEGYVHLPWNNTYVKRTVVVETISQSMFSKAMVVRNGIYMNGNNVRVDSYDSRDSTKSTSGQYDPAKAQANGDVVCSGGFTDTLSVGNADIWGRIVTGPQGTAYIGPGGSVGGRDWHLANKNGIQPGWWLNDMNVNFPAVKAPFTGAPPLGTSANWAYVADNGNYMASSLNGNLLVKGPTTIYVTGSANIPTLQILNKGNLTLYVGGAKLTLGAIKNDNTSINATNLILYGLPTCKQLDISQNTDLCGIVYMPDAYFKIYGGLQVSGCIVAGDCELTGHSQFHYDEALSPRGPPRGFLVSAWYER